jgi:hypothetical protein
MTAERSPNDTKVWVLDYIETGYKEAKDRDHTGFWTETQAPLANIKGRAEMAIELGIITVEEAEELHDKYFPKYAY